MTILVVLMTSCLNVLDNKIDTSTIETEIKNIKTNNPDLDSTKTKILNNLLALSIGRDRYIAEKWDSKEKTESLKKYLVDEDRFKEVKDTLFNYFKTNEITYRRLLIEIDSLTALDEKYENKMKSVYEELDKICIEKQNEIDEKDVKAKEIKERLNKMVLLEVISIRETDYNYRDVVEVKIKMTNKTDKPIEAISFDLTLTDKLGDKVAKIGCKSNNRFTTSRIASYIYGEYDNRDIYNSLKNINASHVTATNEITKINHGGELISPYDDELESFSTFNLYYKTPNKLNGYCHYLNDEHDLIKKIEKARLNNQKEIKKETPTLYIYQEMEKKLFEF